MTISCETNKPKSFEIKDIGIILIALIGHCYWTSILISTKIGLLNFLPTFVFISMWYFFTKISLDIKYSRWYFLLGFLITLRIPVTISPQLEFISWILYLSIISLIGYKFFKYFQHRKQLIILCLAIAIVFFNSFTHLFLDSPFTYSFRLIDRQPSNYVSGKDNNLTWECSYEDANFPVHCDMRHFIPSEKIFTEPSYDAAFSVFLTRFFYGYLNSLVGIQGHRWFMSFSLNIFLWISACIAMYRIGEIVNFSVRALNITILCCASSWGFVHFVAQPSPHMSAFAFSAIILWSTLELIHNEFINTPLLILLIVSGSLVYDVYPLILISAILLFIYKRPVLGILIPLLSIILNIFWKYISLQQILGTLGNIQSLSSPSSGLTYSFQNWTKAILNFDIDRIGQFISNGFMAYLDAGMIFGAIASTSLLVYLAIKKRDVANPEGNQLLFNISVCFCSVMLVAMFFVAAQSEIWSPTKYCPRFGFYIYPINTLAIAFLTDKFINSWAYIAPIATFIVANITLTKLASMSVFFEYGLVGLYWQ
ncbi:MAG: hypothetical protein DCF19_18635 [Pseudanabaena frigida]|uniref:Glycosyltransferase RgtA/B/C/D-like domain-containing protein n=1 Tax=Pseudanabaena frigida TaxID=945775 RepID=A0A2W4VZT2_9CYAN|nr:MAG: hypothetical protein DCF19_18635 [Pseudanabaena frigida]